MTVVPWGGTFTGVSLGKTVRPPLPWASGDEASTAGLGVCGRVSSWHCHKQGPLKSLFGKRKSCDSMNHSSQKSDVLFCLHKSLCYLEDSSIGASLIFLMVSDVAQKPAVSVS